MLLLSYDYTGSPATLEVEPDEYDDYYIGETEVTLSHKVSFDPYWIKKAQRPDKDPEYRVPNCGNFVNIK